MRETPKIASYPSYNPIPFHRNTAQSFRCPNGSLASLMAFGNTSVPSLVGAPSAASNSTTQSIKALSSKVAEFQGDMESITASSQALRESNKILMKKLKALKSIFDVWEAKIDGRLSEIAKGLSTMSFLPGELEDCLNSLEDREPSDVVKAEGAREKQEGMQLGKHDNKLNVSTGGYQTSNCASTYLFSGRNLSDIPSRLP
jgi:hypothetical protein